MHMNNTPFRVLIVDDTPSIHEDFRKVLESPSIELASTAAVLTDMESVLFGEAVPVAGTSEDVHFEIDSALQGQAGLEKVKQALTENRPYAMAFVDMRMPPGWDGVQTIRELWKVDPNLQIAICTAYSDYTPEQISRELKLDGRMLILRKPFDKIEARQLAIALCDKWQLVARKAELEKIIDSRTVELMRIAMHDALTGLPNRRLFSDRLDRTLQRQKRDASHRFAVLFVDVDEFKVVNDTLGHEAGDKLLLQIADRMNETIRKTLEAECPTADSAQPMAARLGGDEFAILLDNIKSDDDARRLAEQIVTIGTQPYLIEGRPVRCTLSVGITTNAIAYRTADEILRDADTAMYHAKRNGRSRFVMFSQKMHAEAMARLSFETDLRVAVEQNQIDLHYQPIVDARDGGIVGFEALARWEHPTRGSVSPVDFIPVAEETGLIIPLGAMVLEKACRQLAIWQSSSQQMANLTMSVNLSRKQLTSVGLLDHLDRVLKETGIKPECLKLEITESCVMTDTRSSLEMLQKIQSRNVQLHIDDFGTGYSSLSCIQHMPLTGLKIDGGFMTNLESKPSQQALLSAIVKLAHSMNMPLVSEGVETAEQAAMLQAMGCDYIQGFLFARPMDAQSASDFIQRHITSETSDKSAAA